MRSKSVLLAKRSVAAGEHLRAAFPLGGCQLADKGLRRKSVLLAKRISGRIVASARLSKKVEAAQMPAGTQ